MKWGDLQPGDVMHADEDDPYESTTWLLLDRGGPSTNGMIEFRWLSLNDGSVVTTKNLRLGELTGYRLETR